jgi:hypothetical protein
VSDQPEYEPTAEELYQVGLMIGDPKALAMCWLKHYAEALSTTSIKLNAEEMIRVALTNINPPTKGVGEHLEVSWMWGDIQTPETFWDHLEIILGYEIKDSKRCNFLSIQVAGIET